MLVEGHIDEEVKAISEIAHEMGLSWDPIIWETVPPKLMAIIATYGLPLRMRHFSYAPTWTQQKAASEYGMVALETIINNNPTYAFMHASNNLVTNKLIIAHCMGHAHVFKNNIQLSKVPKDMVQRAADSCLRVERYKEMYGEKEVEDFITMAFALERHLDWFTYTQKGENRPLYPKKERTISYTEPDIIDLLTQESPQVTSKVSWNYETFPPRKEPDLLWFLAHYAPDLEEWQKDVLLTVRAESYYFYPQFLTKTINEGFASLVHIVIMEKYLNDMDMVDFAALNSAVINPGWDEEHMIGRMGHNPYYIGYKILRDIWERWDDYYTNGLPKDMKLYPYPQDDNQRFRDEDGNIVKATIKGWDKVLEVVKFEDDPSFYRTYLTDKLMYKLHLCTMQRDNETGEVILKNRSIEDFCFEQSAMSYDYGVPRITIQGVADSGALILAHENHQDFQEFGLELKLDECEVVMRYMEKIWKRSVILGSTINGEKKVLVCKDGKII